MVYRYMYCGYGEEKCLTFFKNSRAKQISASYFRGNVFLYFETEEENLPPETVADGKLTPFPDGKKWFPMPDIFHYSRPLSEETWRRKTKGKMPWVRINRVRPEKLSRYIYFHYQFEEERLGKAGDKYGCIFLFGNTIVMYMEFPVEPETEKLEGDLDTQMTPADDQKVWDSIMSEFFLPWENYPFEWHEMLTVTPDGKEYRIPSDYDKQQEKLK